LAPKLGGHIPVLDGLRGLAIVLVVFNHLGHSLQEPFGNRIDYLLLKLSGSAWCGVDLFFVLSGFLITGILADSLDGPHYFRNFYARRALRIFPLYYGFLLVLFALLPGTPLAIADSFARDHQLWYWAYLDNILFAITGVLPASTFYMWSLAVEEQFYLAWPLLVLLVPRRPLTLLAASIVPLLFILRIALVPLVGLTQSQVYVLTPLRLDALAAGAFVALTARQRGGWAWLARVAPAVALVSGAMSVALAIYKPILALALRLPMSSVNTGTLRWDSAVQTTRFTAYAIFFAALLVLVMRARESSALARTAGSTPMRMFGRYSYAMYMFNVPVAFLAQRFGFGGDRLPVVAGMQWPRALLFFAMLLTATTTLAFISWNVYEKHFLKLKDLFPYERGTRREADDSVEADRELFASP
jgi:peptidoglycan/LPS O-acetylase OafA/YrhL